MTSRFGLLRDLHAVGVPFRLNLMLSSVLFFVCARLTLSRGGLVGASLGRVARSAHARKNLQERTGACHYAEEMSAIIRRVREWTKGLNRTVLAVSLVLGLKLRVAELPQEERLQVGI